LDYKTKCPLIGTRNFDVKYLWTPPISLSAHNLLFCRKEARIVVDGALKAEVREPPGPVRALHLTSDLVVGE
jgi:hypothetical protein